jgi:hypothetical protein
MSRFRIPSQLIPPIVMFALAGLALIITRQILVPKTFGEYGHYRGAAVEEIASRQPVYAGYQACLDCHDDIYQTKSQGSHRGLNCETCHGAAAAHAQAPDSTLPTVPRGRDYCLLCHAYNPSRPTGFPQIISENHNPGKACTSCHNSHSPQLKPEAEECSTCHRGIANQKAVSAHAPLPCTRCHTVPKEHLIEPRLVEAEKPRTRDLCGQCHATGADSPAEIPRIDLATHGRNVACWECHYPHFPEAR